MSTRAREPRVLASSQRRRLLGLLVLNGFGQALAATALALAVQRGFDRLIAGGPRADAGEVAALTGTLLAAALAGGWLRARERVDAERLGQRYVHAVRMALYDRLVAVSPRTLHTRSHGGVLLRFVGDLTMSRQGVSLGLARLIVAGTAATGAVAGLVVLDPLLGAVVGAMLVAGAAVVLASGNQLRERSRSARRRRTRLAANLSEQVSAVAVVIAFAQGERERRRFVRQSRLLGQAMVGRAETIGRLRGITETFAALVPCAVMLVGALQVSRGTSPGTVVAAMMLAGLLTPMLRDLGRVPEYWHGAAVSLEKVRGFLATPRLARVPRGAPDLAVDGGELAFEGVSVKGSLEDVSAVAPPGAVVAVVGPNGSGKSTLLALAARLLDPEAGRVLIDGQDLTTVTAASVREAVGVAGPDVPLLSGDVERNLRYRCPDAGGEELLRVRELTGLDAVLDDLPDAEATRMLEGGRGLSAGQRDRLALARAIVGDPAVLLLDEVDAHLHTGAAAAVHRVIEERRGRRTTLVVTHRDDLLASADFVWHMDAGRIVSVRSAGRELTPILS
jgi:ABC-type multidrug transport system fused ATPase/permease subunit